MLKHSKERFSYVEERLQTYVTDRDEKEVMARNEEESDKFVRILKEQVQCLEASKSELKSELDNTKNELSRLHDAYNSMEAERTSAMALKDSEIEQKNELLREKEQLAVNSTTTKLESWKIISLNFCQISRNSFQL